MSDFLMQFFETDDLDEKYELVCRTNFSRRFVRSDISSFNLSIRNNKNSLGNEQR